MSGPTMSAVARAAGVSVSTVSHFVNGTRQISAETRDRVRAAMERLGYVHHPVARSLGAGTGRTVGLAVTVTSNPYWMDLVAAVDEAAAQAGLQLVIVDTMDEEERELRVISNLLARHVDGLIMTPSPTWRRRVLPILREHPVPYVLMDRFERLRVDQVGVENTQPVRTLVEHLIDLGHRRIGIVTGRDGVSTTAERSAGYIQALNARDLDVDPALLSCGYSTVNGGARAMDGLLRLPDRPTAVFVSNNCMTIGALQAVAAHGLKVPADLALVCFDDHPWAGLFEPRLTAIAQPNRRIGTTAVSLLEQRLNDALAPPQLVRLSPSLAHRNSCGCRA